MIFKIINKYNPAYMLFVVSINSFISFIARLFMDKEGSVYDSWCIILDCIGLILLSLGGTLFNEIIIIHNCGLDIKTKYYLNNMAIEEILDSENGDDDFE